jgi:integrase
MGIYKKEICKACGWNGVASKPKKNGGACKKCGASTNYSDNWYYSLKHKGRKIVKSVAPQKREAEIALAKVKVEIRENKHFDKAPSTLWKDAIERYQTYMQLNLSANTVRSYGVFIRQLTLHFKNYSLDQITPCMVEQYKNTRLTEVGKASVIGELGVLGALYSYCKRLKLVEINPVREVNPVKPNKGRTRFLNEEEIDSLLKESKKYLIGKLYIAIQIVLHTGLRKDGVLTLKWQEIDFQRNMIKKVVKGGKEVSIPLSVPLRDVLLTYKRSQKILVLSPYVLPGRLPGKPLTCVVRGFRKALKGIGITGFHFHDLRHTFASHFIMQTKDLKALQEILGHTDIKTTMRYAHLMEEHLSDAMKVFSEGFMAGK